MRVVGTDGPVKIGCSAFLAQRAKSLSTKGRPVELLADIAGDFDVERRFHAEFRADHVGKEWFAPSPRLDSVIEQIKQGAFDIESLPAPDRLPRKPIVYDEVRREAMRMSSQVKQASIRSGWTFNEHGIQPKWCSGDEAFRERVRDYIADPLKHSHRWLFDGTWERWFRDTPARQRRDKAA